MLLLFLQKKRKILFATLLYFLGTLMLVSALYWFMASNGFNEKNFLIAASGVLVVAVAWGYILASDLLAPKREMDEKFSHLSKEILHELNIPLATIDANAKMLKKSLPDEKSQKRLERVTFASLRLKRLYDELLYSINKELHTIEKEPFSLHQLLEERVETLRELGRNPLELSAVDMTLRSDKIGFEQMIDNLLNNAMKYSPKESAVEIRNEGKKLLICDRGIGMDESQIVKIFERYYQADGKQTGEGIGLTLVKAYCDEVGIDIVIRSKKGEGTTVTLDLCQIIDG
ncbi:MAG: HAMP domain-containing sensor histidine kinase [Campylobacterota bacterium]|nr:HAMP domain-containing sensor histidine kinase [Campylobacterota bacterium]